jgi:hypothetical protein
MFDTINLTQFSLHALHELGYMFVICQVAVQDYSKVALEVTGTIVLFKKFKDISSDSKFSNCRVPTNRNLVFLGLINNEFLQHHSATRRRSVSSLCLASDTSLTENDRDILESSTNEFRSHDYVTVGRSFVYMQKSNGDNCKIAPCGTPWVIGRAADKDEPMRTF